ncbi:MAG TPA: DNA recombination protein RmuC [Candidatus Paceibacterota bacterium]|nr:DNA recombination protein RmuC [Candidatus Paceibacterota bacterium]
MEIILIILIAVLVIINVAIVFLFIRKKETPKDEGSMQLLLQHLNDLNRTVDQKISESGKEMRQSIQHQTSESQKIIRDVTERLTKLDETNRQVLGFSDQLKKLQDTLTNPKQRGILGEYFLEETLKNVLPPNSYQMQYKFTNGEIVDAVVFVKEKIIPIDSKFSLENYQRLIEETDPIRREEIQKLFKEDLKRRIDETAKYVRPNENTMDFAFMFIPSESIYYDLLINKIGTTKVSTRDLIEYAFKEKKVVIVSPTSFLAYLQTVLQGLRAMQIEESAKGIRKKVESLAKHILSYDDYLKKLGGHLSTTVNTYNTAYKEFKKIDKDVVKITDKGGEIEVLEIAKPESDQID